MAKPHERVAAFIIAVLFLATSVAAGAAVIWQINQDNQASEQTLTQGADDMLQGTQLENYEPVESVDELQVIDLQEGEGEVVEEGATVTAHYTGAIATTGVIFESSKDGGQPANFPLSGVIAGWQQGVPGMKVGGVRRLIIPAELAYGETGSPPAIGPNEPLVFDIEMISVEQ